jgi:hypothetical protein
MFRNMLAARARVTAVALATLCTVGIGGPASAQFGLRGRMVGTCIGVPLGDYGRFVAGNIIGGNNVNFLHLSQVAVGDFNNQVVTTGVTQRNTGQPARTCYIPTHGTNTVPDVYKAINVNDQYIEQTAVGTGNNQVVQVDVSQSNDQLSNTEYVPGRTRFFKTPVEGVSPIKSVNVEKNINEVDIQQTAVGDANTQVALVSVDQANAINPGNNVKVPGEALVNAVVNVNTNVVVQTAVGNGNNQVATVGVQQQNAPIPTP